MRPRLFLFAAGILAMSVSPVVAADPVPATATLAITVHNISDAGGDLRIGVYDEKSFAEKGGVPVAHKVTHARGPTMTITFDDIAPGTYGAKVLQDLNRNGQFDMGLKGIEPFGFSNDPEIKGGLPPSNNAKPNWIRMSAPSFEEAKIVLKAGANWTEIWLH